MISYNRRRECGVPGGMEKIFLRNVLLIKGNYDRAGGGESMVATQLTAMDSSRYAPTLAILQKPGLAGSTLLRDAAPDVPRIEVRWRGIAGAPAAAAALRKIIVERKIDLLHTHDMRANLAAWLLVQRSKIPWVAHVHGWLGHTHAGRFVVYEGIDRQFIRWAGMVIVGSDAARAEVEAAGAKNVAVVPNAVPLPTQIPDAQAIRQVRDEVGCLDGELLVGVLGRVHPGKGQSFLLRAVAAARRGGLAVRALIVGEGPDLEHCRLLVKELKIEPFVTFTGFAPDAMRFLWAMDVVVVPSLKESLPLTAMEAMVRGLPIIASAVGDLPRLIEDGKTGLLVPPSDVQALRDAIERYAADPVARQRIAEQGRTAAIARHAAPAMARAIEDLYDKLLEGGHG